MLVLVTGGAGFIGSHLVDALLERGDRVRVLDNLSTGRRENLAHVLRDIEFVEGDLRDRDTVTAVMEKVDAVLHEGALPSVPRSVKDPVTTNEANVSGTVHVLDAAVKAGVGRVVYASSSSVYGDSPTLPKHEAMAPNPKSPYAVSKLVGEQYCGVFSSTYGLETVPLRYFNVFGPRQDPGSQYSGVIAKFATCALEGRSYPVFGDGLQSRDFTYVQNVVEANLAALNSPHAPGGPMNIARGDRITLRELIQALNHLAGRDLEPEFLPPRAGDIEHSQAAVEIARARLGYQAKVDFAAGMARTLDWYRAQAGGA